jgi:hypothetical protein
VLFELNIPMFIFLLFKIFTFNKESVSKVIILFLITLPIEEFILSLLFVEFIAESMNA